MGEMEEARRSWETERCRLQQEVQELRGAKKHAEETVALAQQACQARAAELRSAHHQHQEELHRTKRDCEREIRRLVGGAVAQTQFALLLTAELPGQTGNSCYFIYLLRFLQVSKHMKKSKSSNS